MRELPFIAWTSPGAVGSVGFDSSSPNVLKKFAISNCAREPAGGLVAELTREDLVAKSLLDKAQEYSS